MGQTEVPSIDDIYKDLLKNFDDSNEQALVLLQKKFDDNSKSVSYTHLTLPTILLV